MDHENTGHLLSSAMDVINSTRVDISALKEKNKDLLDFAYRVASHHKDVVPSSTTEMVDFSTSTDWAKLGQVWLAMNEDLLITKDNIEKMLFTVNCTEQLLQRWLQIFEKTIIQK